MTAPFILLTEPRNPAKFGVLTWCGKERCYRFDFGDMIRARDLPKFGAVRRFTGQQIARILGETK